jgi:hypothetical protein
MRFLRNCVLRVSFLDQEIDLIEKLQLVWAEQAKQYGVVSSNAFRTSSLITIRTSQVFEGFGSNQEERHTSGEGAIVDEVRNIRIGVHIICGVSSITLKSMHCYGMRNCFDSQSTLRGDPVLIVMI